MIVKVGLTHSIYAVRERRDLAPARRYYFGLTRNGASGS